MTDMTLTEALALADQDSPMPHLAGQALKVLRERLMERNAEIEWMNREFERISCLFHNVGPCPECGCHDVEGLRGVSRDDGKMFRCTACGFVAGCKKWPPNPGAHLNVDVKDDSATLTKVINELRQREALGRRKYGTDVDRTDLTGAQWRQHLREELMDALLYSLAEHRTQAAKDCWCEACRPSNVLADMRMVLCPTCGNKRCPHANDHRNACTGSNAVGQPGSSWEHVKPITTSTTKDC